MKKIPLLTVLAIWAFCSQAQITLEQTYAHKKIYPTVILFSGSGTKILVHDTGANQIKLYYTNHSLWKTINVPTYSGYKFFLASIVSDNLFNSDTSIEFVATYNTRAGKYKSMIVDESGSAIFDLDSTYISYVHNIAGSYKLYAVHWNVTLNDYTTKVYALPGTIPCNPCSGSLGLTKTENNSDDGMLPPPVPNPSGEQVKIYYTLPEGVHEGVITLFNANGQTVKTYTVGSAFEYITLDNSNLPQGVYYYNLSGAGIVPKMNKMVVVK